MRRALLWPGLLLFFAWASLPALANSTKVLDFTGLVTGEQPLSFYAGDWGSQGSGPGPNYATTFSSTGFILTRSGFHGNFLAETGPIVMNVTSQFAYGLKFAYLAPAPATVEVWSGLDGTGTLLASLALSATPGCRSLNRCSWKVSGLNISGTASSVTFTGTPGQIGFDNLRVGIPYRVIGSPTPMAYSTARAIVTPEPSSFLLLATGLAGLSLGWWQRRVPID